MQTSIGWTDKSELLQKNAISEITQVTRERNLLYVGQRCVCKEKSRKKRCITTQRNLSFPLNQVFAAVGHT